MGEDLKAHCLPGFSPERIVALMRGAVANAGLDLTGMTVLTEAATGAYGVTCVIAALAGAERVFAFTRASRHGGVAEVREWTAKLAGLSGVADRLDVVEAVTREMLRGVDIVTNSGHLRPLTAAVVDQIPSSAVIALMYEAWELRAGDIDLAACARRGVEVVAVNERHPALDVFSYLGPLCVRELQDCGLPVYGNRIALVCDNEFAEPILRGLNGLGAVATGFAAPGEVPAEAWDAVVIALRPQERPRVGNAECARLAAAMPAQSVLVQFWGDIDRQAAEAAGLRLWPPRAPAAGHMAALLSDIGPDPIVRLQTGGLRAAEWVRRGRPIVAGGFAEIVRPA